MNNKKLILIAGNSCTGKSTTAKVVSSNIKDSYTISFDKLKWGFTNFNFDQHGDIIKNFLYDYIIALAQYNITVIPEIVFMNEEDWDSLKKRAEAVGYKVYLFNLTARPEILLDRFKRRVENALKNNSKISVTDESVFIKNANKFFIPKEGIEIDTSDMDENKVAELILKTI